MSQTISSGKITQNFIKNAIHVLTRLIKIIEPVKVFLLTLTCHVGAKFSRIYKKSLCVFLALNLLVVPAYAQFPGSIQNVNTYQMQGSNNPSQNLSPTPTNQHNLGQQNLNIQSTGTPGLSGGLPAGLAGAAGALGIPRAGAAQPNFQDGYIQPRPNQFLVPTEPTDFEKYVMQLSGKEIRRFGAELVRDGDQSFSPSSTAAVPDDYMLGAGDEIFLRMWGGADADLRLVVDRQGQISIPKIGAVRVAGTKYSTLNQTIQNAVSRMLSGVNVSATLGQMRGIRVFVTGFAQYPGAYTVNNLSSMVNVVMAAGGPSNAGSFRNIQLRRGGKLISEFDLYDLLLRGDKSADRPLTAEDVIYIGPAGGMVAMMGSVNKPAIYELKKGEKIQDLLVYSGGFSAGSISNSINYMGIETRRQGFVSVSVSQFPAFAAKDGDIFYAVSEVLISQPITVQKRMIVVGGEVNKPGVYLLGPNETLQDAITAAGGFTSTAYLYGTKLERISILEEQRKEIERFKSQARKMIANDSLRKQSSNEDVQLAGGAKIRFESLLNSLEEFMPNGRLTLGLPWDSKELPPVLLQTGDVITIPSVPNNVTLIGSIPSGQISLAYVGNKNLSDYIQMAGGYNRGADDNRTYIMRASGQFVSQDGWFSGPSSLPVYPGDVVFVPDNFQKSTWQKELRDWADILFKFGLGAAAIKVLTN